MCRDQAACGPGSAGEIAANDNACGGTCSSVTFACPASGSYTVLVGNQASDSSDDITPGASTGSFPLTVPVAGEGFIGATLEGIDENGAPFDILIADIETDPDDPSGTRIVGDLAQSCSSARGGRTWTFILRRGVITPSHFLNNQLDTVWRAE